MITFQLHGQPRSVRAVVLDLDGVVWLDDEPIEGSAGAVREFKGHGLRVGFLTNTSSASIDELTSKLADHGIQAEACEVMTSSRLLARKIVAECGVGRDVVTVGGGEALLDELRQADLRPVSLESLDPTQRSHLKGVIVAIGYTTTFNHSDAQRLVEFADSVSRCYATDRDRWFAGASGRRPGAAWVVGAVEATLGMTAVAVGKPNGYGLMALADEFRAEIGSLLMVGDSLESDVMAARNAGAISCLFAGRGSRQNGGIEPDLTVRSMNELLALTLASVE